MKARAEAPLPSPASGISRTKRASLPNPSAWRGELAGDLGLKDREVVGEAEPGLAPGAERDPRAFLRAEGKLLPLDPQLAQDLAQGRPLDPGRDVVRNRVQADVVLAPAQAVEAVQPADGVVPLKDADLLAEVGQPYSRREAGETGSDDGDVVVRARIQLFAASALNLGVRYSAQLSSEARRM